jgi:hypothetical protein
MEKEAAVVELQTLWSMVMNQGALLAMLPIEESLRDLERSETIAPILDPTLFRDYLYSGKGDLIKDVLRAAVQFKAAILKAQEQVRSERSSRTQRVICGSRCGRGRRAKRMGLGTRRSGRCSTGTSGSNTMGRSRQVTRSRLKTATARIARSRILSVSRGRSWRTAIACGAECRESWRK